MTVRRNVLLACALLLAGELPAQVVHVGDLNTRQIRALDRARTVVILPGGMLEEHGPYLPAFTDGVLSARLTTELANGIAKQRPGWKVLVFPPVSLGASGSNEIGRQYSYAGTYAIRPSTLRAAFVDLANELGEQGFRWVLVVHVHGSPLHIGAIDDAGDFFRDTHGGTMVNLWGLLPVLGGWGGAMSVMTPAQKKADGVSLHAGMDEHSLMLYLRPDLVARDFRQAPPVAGANYAEAFSVARQPGWQGYLGAPHLATAAFGKRIWLAFAEAAAKTALEILDGKDPATYPRYVTYLKRLPEYRAWIDSANTRDSIAGASLANWLVKRSRSSAVASHDAFWTHLQSLCGRAYRGHLTEGNASDSLFRQTELVMHVRQCTPNEIRIPFHSGINRSRTWVLTRTATGLRLKHDHRHEDGSEDSVTQYGGDTRGAGSADRQEFHADAHTAALIPAARANVWTMEIAPGRRFAYALRREGTDRRFRVEFDLTRSVALPPPPWGAPP